MALRLIAGSAVLCGLQCFARPQTAGSVGETGMDEKLPRALPRDVPNYHSRQAAHFRVLASQATTVRAKTQLLQEAEGHERVALREAEPAIIADK